MLQRLPWPKEPARFEDLCRALWASLDKERRWQRLGRSGQKQYGLDVVGERDGEAWIGIQCKVRDHFLGSTVNTKLVDAWIKKVIDGKQKVQRLILATTAPSDTAVQTHVKARSDASTKAGAFGIDYWAWDRIETALFEPAHEDVLALFFRQYGFRSQRRERIVTYLSGIVPDLQKLPLRHLRDVNAPGVQDPTLAQIYTMLDVDDHVQAGGPSHAIDDLRMRFNRHWSLPCELEEVGELVARVRREAPAGSDTPRDRTDDTNERVFGRPATILEAAAVNPRLVVTGVGGSGKSTFLRYLALCLAGENLRHAGRTTDAGLHELCGADPTRWTHGMLVPLWLELRDFAKSPAFPTQADQATRARLWAYLRARGTGALSEELRSDLEDLMAEQHAVPGVLLVLDGVDELPDRATQTPLLLEVLADFLRQHPRSRVLLTARPYAVDDKTIAAALRHLGFAFVHLAAPSDATLATFLPAWFAQTRGDAALAQPVLAEIAGRPQLRAILRTPLILTLVADMYGAKDSDWKNPADLFESAVRRLVDRWNQGRDIPSAKDLTPHEAAIRHALEDLAWHVQTQVVASARDGERWFAKHVLEQMLERHGIDESKAPSLSRYLEQRCGILECDTVGQFRFPHRNLIEFLAAAHASKLRDHPLPLLAHARRNVGDYREILLFAGALGARGEGVGAWTLLDHAVPEPPPADVRADDARLPLVAVCAQMVVDNRMLAPDRPSDRVKLERLRAWMKACLTVGALAPPERAAVGRHLALVGDDRKGVGLDTLGLPDIDWVRVDMPDGTKLDVARYPVTNAQFAAFVADGGYTDKLNDGCWSVAGLTWRKQKNLAGPALHRSDTFSLPNHPQVHVSAHEAVAFCAWLGGKLGREIRLPTDDERKFASCGKENRGWAWGHDYGDGTRSNGPEARIGSTCAVGIFPNGQTPDFGLHDMSGNVLEWTVRMNNGEGVYARVWGGSWILGSSGMEPMMVPGASSARNEDLGFRVVAPATP